MIDIPQVREIGYPQLPQVPSLLRYFFFSSLSLTKLAHKMGKERAEAAATGFAEISRRRLRKWSEIISIAQGLVNRRVKTSEEINKTEGGLGGKLGWETPPAALFFLFSGSLFFFLFLFFFHLLVG